MADCLGAGRARGASKSSFLTRIRISSSLLRNLNKVSDQVSELQLANTNVDDDMLSGIGKFKHLRKLKLQNTPITNKTISRLTALDHLESLNLYGSTVTDEILDDIKELKQLSIFTLFKNAIFSWKRVLILRTIKTKWSVLAMVQKYWNWRIFGA